MNQPADEQPVLDAKMRVDSLPLRGRTLKVKTSADECTQIAKMLQVENVDSFSAKLSLTPIKRGILVKGELRATIQQPSVVTFKPVTQHIEEKVNRIFLLGNGNETVGGAGSESFIDLEGNDLPDYFEGPVIDFSGLLLETLALAVNPFPRAAGEEVDIRLEEKAPERASPFAILKKLKSD